VEGKLIMGSSSPPVCIGVGIDTARYGHHASFLNEQRNTASPPLIIMETREGYDKFRKQLENLQKRYPAVNFHVRIDAGGQYATNLEHYIRSLPLPITLSIGEPKRNKDYCQAHFPKRKADPIESLAMARYAVVERPSATHETPDEFQQLREVTSRMQGQVKDLTRSTNRLHDLLSRVFPELALLTKDISSVWVLGLLRRYPSAQRIARAQITSLVKIPYLTQDKAKQVRDAAKQTIGSVQGEVAESLVCELVEKISQHQKSLKTLEKLMENTFRQLPESGHIQVESIAGIGVATAAVLVAKIICIDRFETADNLVGYFGVFPHEYSSGIDRNGKPYPLGKGKMCKKGNDLVRRYLWNASFSAIQHNPAVRALYTRLRERGTRGDVAMGHCMRKLLHLVFAVWKTNQPFNKEHYPWEKPKQNDEKVNEKTAGHKQEHFQESVCQQVVSAVDSKVQTLASEVNAEKPSRKRESKENLSVDFAFLREHITIEQVLRHLGHYDQLRGSSQQLRGPCPLHGSASIRSRTFSVELGKNAFQCFKCKAKGNAIDLWAHLTNQTAYDAALDIAETFNLRLRPEQPRKEEPVTRNT
jgi:transposase